jgi:hypothetical protein
VLREPVELLERVLVEEVEDPLHRGPLASGVLLVHRGLPAARRLVAAGLQVGRLARRRAPIWALFVDGCRAHRSS